MFIRDHDIQAHIQPQEFERLQDHHKAKERAYRSAIDEARHYLDFRFDTDKIFIDVPAWDPNTTYSEGDVVSLEAKEWSSGIDYQVDDLAMFELEVYKATAQNTNQEPTGPEWSKVGPADTFFVSQSDSNTNDPNGSDWVEKDPRDGQVVRVILDLLLYELYSMTQPRNIPEYRMQRKEAAHEWLKQVNKGNLTTSLPEASVSDDTDQRVQYGSFPYKGFKW